MIMISNSEQNAKKGKKGTGRREKFEIIGRVRANTEGPKNNDMDCATLVVGDGEVAPLLVRIVGEQLKDE